MMTFRIGKSAVLPFVSLASVLALGVPHAGAENIFDTLFGRHRFPAAPPPPQQIQPQQPQATRAPVSLPKVSEPTYHDYVARPLVKVDFNPILTANYPQAAMPAAPSSADVQPAAQPVPDAQAAVSQPAGDAQSPAGTQQPANQQPGVSQQPEASQQPAAQSDGFIEARGGLDGFALMADRQVAKAVADYYSKNPHFIWITGNAPNARAEQAMKVLGDAASYGLNPIDYAVTPPQADSLAGDPSTRMKELMRFEMKMSARVLRYVSDATNGRINPDLLSDYFDLPQKPLDMQAVLTALSTTGDATAYLQSFQPQDKQYRALRDELARLRQSDTSQTVHIDPQTLVKPGESSPEFPKVLQLISDKADDAYKTQYGALLSSHSGDIVYSNDLIPAIKAAQKAHGLSPDGVVGPHTIQAFQGVSNADKIEKVLVGLEELRWLPHKLGNPYVFINVPAFRVTYTKDGVDQLSMRAVVGKPTNQTTFFYNTIKEVTFNPYWGVPRSIIVNEMLPRLLKDPGYLDRSGYEVTDNKGHRIPSASINWGRYGANIPFNVRQEPSEENALGVLKILFPNKHAIYMHDTPEKALFKRDVRAFSHGCVRLQEPKQMAAAVLDTSVDQVDDRLKQGHNSEKVPVQIPVYVAYFTAWPDEAGKVNYYNDIYGRDPRILDAIQKVESMREPQDADLTGAVQSAPLSAPRT